MGLFRFALARAIPVVALLWLPAAALADATTDKAAAIEALEGQALVYSNFADEIAETLSKADTYVFGDPFNEWVGLVTVTKQQVDAFVGYLQVENLLHPGQLDAATLKAANALKINKQIAELILQDRAAVLATGGAANAHERLRKISDQNRAALADTVKQLRQEADDLVSESVALDADIPWPPKADNVFSPVQVNGVTVDYCLSFATDCGQPVADTWCVALGYKHAKSFEWTYMHPTKTLSSGETCDADYCGGFTSITCE